VPELPEVETIVRDLRPALVGRRIGAMRKSTRSLRSPWKRSWRKHLQDACVQSIERRGKWIIISLDRAVCLLVHLGMTGQLRVFPASDPVARHTHLIFELDGGRAQLRFRDVRRFGQATVIQSRALSAFFDKTRLGPEPFKLDASYWDRRLGETRRSLKAVLLDQSVVAGIGNIYADEALFEARLHPARTACGLTAAERLCLRRVLPKVLNRAIEGRGSTIRDYVDGTGQGGGYQNEFRAYGRAGEPCVRCDRSIRRIRLAGRSTHFCPGCQSLRPATRAGVNGESGE
jgi:formamidopyrimidine-DNA glycosylase